MKKRRKKNATLSIYTRYIFMYLYIFFLPVEQKNYYGEHRIQNDKVNIHGSIGKRNSRDVNSSKETGWLLVAFFIPWAILAVADNV
jgi:hypothetical protein